MADHLTFKGFDTVGECLLSDQIESNVMAFIQYAYLTKGGFVNVTIPTTGAYGGHSHRLRPVDEPNYSGGQVWEGHRQDWVWETGIPYYRQPIRVSGVYTNGTFRPATGVGAYAHKIDYARGRVLFDSPISTGTTLTAEYSYRLYNVYPAHLPFWRELQYNSFRVDDSTFLQMSSGNWSVLAQNRIQLPAIVVQAVPNQTRSPLMLGDSSHIVKQDVLLDVLCENPWERSQISDALCDQQDKRLVAFNKNWVYDAGKFGLDWDGTVAPSGLDYSCLVKATGDGGYGWKQLRIIKTASSDQPLQATAPLSRATVRWTMEIDTL